MPSYFAPLASAGEGNEGDKPGERERDDGKGQGLRVGLPRSD